MAKGKKLDWVELSGYNNLLITLTTLNNKGRKGKYIYVRNVNTKKKSIYKFNDKYDLTNYVDAFNKEIKFTKKGIKRVKEKKVKEIKVDIKSIPMMDKVLPSGQSNIEIKELGLKSSNSLRGRYKELLKPLVKDKLLIDVLSSYGNVEKWKQRLFYKIEVIESDGGKGVITLRTHGKHIENVYKDIKSVIIGNKIDLLKVHNLVNEKGYAISHQTNIKYGEYPEDIKIKLTIEYTKK